jgi:hypothetical protein
MQQKAGLAPYMTTQFIIDFFKTQAVHCRGVEYVVEGHF